MDYILHEKDLPSSVKLKGDIAVDCEMMGLNPMRDRLCLVQLSDDGKTAHLVRIHEGQSEAKNLKKLLESPDQTKIFHFARTDMQFLKHQLGITVAPVYCTKMASKLCRTYTERHGYKDICREVLGIEISKQQQLSDWGNTNLSDEQLTYAAMDVAYLHILKEKLDERLKREGRIQLAKGCFDFLKTRVELDLLGLNDLNIFPHTDGRL